MHADTISAFNFNATFTNGAVGTGMVNIDVTTGVPTLVDISVMGLTGPTYTFDSQAYPAGSNAYYV